MKYCHRCHHPLQPACRHCGESVEPSRPAKWALFVRKDGTAIAGPDPGPGCEYWQVPHFDQEDRSFSFSKVDFKEPMVKTLTFRRVSAQPPVYVEVE